MTAETLSLWRGRRGLWAGLIITEIVVGLTAVLLPLTLTLSALILIPVLCVFYMKPILGLLCVIPVLPNILLKFYSIGPADITLLEVTLFLAILSWMFLCIREKKMVMHGSGSDVAIALLISWSVFTLFWAPATTRGVYQIIKMIPGLTLYYLHVQFVRSKKDFDLLLSAWIVMAAFFTIIGFFETMVYGIEAASKLAGTGKFVHLTRDVRANVFFKSPDDLGFILSISIVVAIAKYTTTSFRGWRLFLVIFLPLMLFVLLSTFSRKSILAVFVTCCYISWHNKKVFRSLLGLSAIGVVMVFVLGSTGFLETLGHRLQSYFMSPQVAIASRVELWSLGWRSFSQSPVFGNGLGSFYVMAATRGIRFSSMHNFYLFILNELGLVGFMLLLFWGFQVGNRTARFFRVNRDEAERLIGRTIVGGFIVLIITGFFRAMNLIDPIFWGFMGMSAAFLKIYLPEERVI
jgi:O-antigen ligase